jgi:hypothetical protein
MVYKNQLLALQTQVQAYGPNRSVVAGAATSLVVHGVLDSVARAHFDVSSTLFEAAAAEHKVYFYASINGNRAFQIGHDLTLCEGVRLGVVMVDGIHVYDLETLYVRYDARSRGEAIWAGHISVKIAERLAELAKPKPEAVAPVKPGPTWGELNEAETAYEQRCSRADWYYSYSDDIRVFRAGKESCEKLKAEAAEQGGNYALIYKYHSTR